jgi:hypothetical protein
MNTSQLFAWSLPTIFVGIIAAAVSWQLKRAKDLMLVWRDLGQRYRFAPPKHAWNSVQFPIGSVPVRVQLALTASSQVSNAAQTYGVAFRAISFPGIILLRRGPETEKAMKSLLSPLMKKLTQGSRRFVQMEIPVAYLARQFVAISTEDAEISKFLQAIRCVPPDATVVWIGHLFLRMPDTEGIVPAGFGFPGAEFNANVISDRIKALGRFGEAIRHAQVGELVNPPEFKPGYESD